MPELPVSIIIKEQPVERLFVVPFDKLTEFAAHKEKLFAGMRHHIAEERTNTRKLFFIAARHFIDERAFAVNNLVMRNRKNKILGKRIEE